MPPFGFHVVRTRTYGQWVVMRGMREPDGSSDAAVATLKQFRCYPFAEMANPRETIFIDASGKDLDTIHPNRREVLRGPRRPGAERAS